MVDVSGRLPECSGRPGGGRRVLLWRIMVCTRNTSDHESGTEGVKGEVLWLACWLLLVSHPERWVGEPR